MGLTTLPPSCAKYLSESLGGSTIWNSQGLSRPVVGFLNCFSTRWNRVVSFMTHPLYPWEESPLET
jgi:hypothetical protein